MIEWLIAAAAFGLAMLAMVFAVPHLKPRKGSGGFGISLMMIFASVFDPARAAAVDSSIARRTSATPTNARAAKSPSPPFPAL